MVEAKPGAYSEGDVYFRSGEAPQINQEEFVARLCIAKNHLKNLGINILPSELIALGINQCRSRLGDDEQNLENKFSKMDCARGLIEQHPHIREFDKETTYQVRDNVSVIFEANIDFPCVKTTKLSMSGVGYGSKVNQVWEKYGL